MTSDSTPAHDDDATRLLVNRVGLLHKLLADRRTWQQAQAMFGEQGTPSVGWINRDGQIQLTLLTHDFLRGHDSVLHAVTDDLMQCGPDGQRLVRVILGIDPPSGAATDDTSSGAFG